MRAGIVAAAVLAAGMGIPNPAGAIDAGDVMDRMERKERLGFIGGAVDMASHLYAVAGKTEKANCAVNWYFREEDSLRAIFDFLDAHKEVDAVGLISILIDRRCGE